MPSSAKARNRRGVEINFDEATHRYWSVLTERIIPSGAVPRFGPDPFPGISKPAPHGKDVELTVNYVSGTTFVNHFFPKFDPDGKIAESCARKRGISVDQLKFEWAQNAKEACEFGTRVHETAEDTLYGRQYRNQPRNEKEYRYFTHVRNAALQILAGFDVIGIEQMVFDVGMQIAGSIDLLARSKKDGAVWIFDWKTNKAIAFSSKYGTKALAPIAHLDDCEAVHYGLQLSTYHMILLTGEYFPHGTPIRRGIFHITDGGPVFHELPDYSVEVRDMAIAMLEQPPF